MSHVQTQAEADALNRDGHTAPYRAVNGHTMIAPVFFPRDANRVEREYRVGDEVRTNSAAAWCAEGCDHSEIGPPPEDW